MSTIITVHGVTQGEHKTRGIITININKYPCKFHVVHDDINIGVDGIIGCDILQKLGGKIDMSAKFVELGKQIIPFQKNETVTIMGRSKQVIYVKVKNAINQKIGILPRLELNKKLHCA